MVKHVRALEPWLDAVGPAAAFEALANTVPDAVVFAVDADRNVIAWSDGAEALLGFKRQDVIGQHCLKANRCRECMVGCGIAEFGRVSDVPIELYRADGEVRAFRKSARGFFDAEGVFLGGLEVLVPDTGACAAAPSAPATDDVQRFHDLISAEPSMHQVFQTCTNVAQTEASVLVRGESGTGKELVARAIHAESARADGPFVAVNCAAMSASLMESELFGHVKGAFTGAVADREGIFRAASGGTLFLDEVAELPLDLQSKLLRVLEARQVTPVGSSRAVPVDVRIVAATHQSLRAAVAAGRFREDLMFRLRVVPIFLPPLRERRRDIAALLWRFIDERNQRGPRRVGAVAPSAMRALLDHAWPGNVRELRNVVDYAFAVGRAAEITIDELPPELREAKPLAAAAALDDVRDDERGRIEAALRRSEGRVAEAAELLGVSRATLWRKRKKYDL